MGVGGVFCFVCYFVVCVLVSGVYTFAYLFFSQFVIAMTVIKNIWPLLPLTLYDLRNKFHLLRMLQG